MEEQDVGQAFFPVGDLKIKHIVSFGQLIYRYHRSFISKILMDLGLSVRLGFRFSGRSIRLD